MKGEVKNFCRISYKPIIGHVTRGDNNKGQILGIAKVKSSSSILWLSAL